MTGVDNLERYAAIAKSVVKAQRNEQHAVLAANCQVLDEARELLCANKPAWLMGVKDTSTVDRALVARLVSSGFLWHTIDKAAARGRAIDVDLTNPLTGYHMTGSSSGTAINVLMGVNDIGLGTDGGGSVLAPALACNLYSVLLAGCGLKVNSKNVSTDGIAFTAAHGLMTRQWSVMQAALAALGVNTVGRTIAKVAIPRVGNIALPDGRDMRAALQPVVRALTERGIVCVEHRFPDFCDRAQAIQDMRGMLDICDTVITFEGPVDVLGCGDSVYGLSGPYASRSQQSAGKYLVKVANMLDMTAVTLPWGDAASGIVFATMSGIDKAASLTGLIEKLAGTFERPALHEKYFAAAGFSKPLAFSL